MVLKAYGVVGSMSTLDFNQILEDVGEADSGMAVMDGFAVTAASGLTFSVAAGRSLQCGTNVFNDAPMTKTLAARSTGNRIDRLVLQVDLSKGRDTAATLEVVQGRAVATGAPVAPQLIQDVVVQHKWQTPLAQILVPPTGALTITDDRPGVSRDLPFTQMVISGSTWAQNSPAFGVSRRGDWIEMTGQITRTGGAIALGDTATFGGTPVIPAGFLPRHQVVAHSVSGITAGDIAEQRWIFQPDGTCTLYPVRGTLATGRVVRVDTTVYLGV